MLDNEYNGFGLVNHENEDYVTEDNQDFLDDSIEVEELMDDEEYQDGLTVLDEEEGEMTFVDQDGDGYTETTIITYDDINKDGVVRAHKVHIDTDGDGIDDYLATYLEVDTNNSGEVDAMISMVDSDGDGQIDIYEKYNDYDQDGKVDNVKIYSGENNDGEFDTMERLLDYDGVGVIDTKAKFSTEKFLNHFKTSKAVLSVVPLGYVPNLPIVTTVNGILCFRVPLMKYKVDEEVDEALVYPVKYVFTVTIPECAIINFENLTYNGKFVNVNFSKPIGTFRHEAVKDMNKEEYAALRSKLFASYDKMIDFLVNNAEYTENDKETFVTLINQVLDPSLKPFYHALDKRFATRFLR